MRSIIPIALVLSALVLSPNALACGTSNPEVTVPTPTGTLYVDNDVCQPGCIISIFVYQESNGRAGLQRADSQVDNTCGGLIPADTKIV